MKHLTIVSLCLLLFCQNIQAQKIKKGDLDFLKNQKEIHLVFDWSNVIIDNKTEEDFVDIKAINSREDWKNEWYTTIKKGFELKFKAATNGIFIETLDMKVGDYPNANVTALIKLQRIDSDGEVYASVIFSNNNSDEPIITVKINGDGGMWGTVENLFGDGFTKAGISLGKIIVKNLE